MSFTRDFSEIKMANAFSKKVGGKIFVHYDWDLFRGFVRLYRVEYKTET